MLPLKINGKIVVYPRYRFIGSGLYTKQLQ